VEEAAKIFLRILKGEGSWAQHAVVLANAALALHGTGQYASYNAAYDAAVDSLESGKAYASFQTLISLQ
ncbi:MAG: anthranilate phosphoribosyltransferase, partial [Chitinophagaceae bacterium]